jgi:hypothetical protein
MNLLTLLGYTPLTPHQEARAKLWRDALHRQYYESAFKDEWGTHATGFDIQYYGITHRRRRRDFLPGATIPTEEDAARFFARLDEDPQTWIEAEERRFRDALEERMRPFREQEARRRALKTSLTEWLALSPIEFEHACADLLRRSGYSDVRVTQASADGGVDIIATKDSCGVAVQCKQYRHPVGPEPVRALAGVVASHPQKFSGGGLIMTTNWFSKAAWREGQQAKLTLITGTKLVEMAQAADAKVAAAVPGGMRNGALG